MYGIYGNIYHQYTPNVSIYTSTMDPMGYSNHSVNQGTTAPLFFQAPRASHASAWKSWLARVGLARAKRSVAMTRVAGIS